MCATPDESRETLRPLAMHKFLYSDCALSLTATVTVTLTVTATLSRLHLYVHCLCLANILIS